MAKDHFVARTYLQRFCGPDGMLYAYRKTDLNQFPTRPADICREIDGDVIPDFLSNPTILGDFRAIFEPQWNPAIDELLTGKYSDAGKMTIAGY